MTTKGNFDYFGLMEEDIKQYYDEDAVLPKAKKAKLDGYEFGDRLLEGVMFIYTINNDGSLSVEVEESSKDYFDNFNKEKWLKIALQYAIETDCFLSFDNALNAKFDIDLITKDGRYAADAGIELDIIK